MRVLHLRQSAGPPRSRLPVPEEVLAIAGPGRAAGCHEALFTLGEGPEDRYPVAAEWLAAQGYASTVDYLAACAARVGGDRAAPPRQRRRARRRRASHAAARVGRRGSTMESLAEGLDAHRAAPDKVPAERVATLDAAGELAIPFTTGLLVGIGDTRADRSPRCPCHRRPHARHGHVQEVIVRNFLPKAGTAMFRAAPCPRGPALGHCSGLGLVLPARHPRAGAPQPVRRARPAAQQPVSTTGAACPRSRPTT